MAVFVRKLLRIGRLPSALRDAAESEGLIFCAEYLPVTRRFSGSVPGLRSSGSIAGYVGALVLTNERVLATLSSVPKLAGRTVDQRWDAAQVGAAKAEITASGLTIDIDVADVDPRCNGHLSLHYKEQLPDDVLAQLPRRLLAFDVPPEFIFRAVGVPYHP